jgi:hypothetical protein
MQLSKTALFIAFVFAVHYAAAQDEHADHHPEGEAQPVAAQVEEHDHGATGSGSLEAGMKRIETLMAEIRATDNPAHQRQLLAGHLSALQEQMKLLRSQRASTMAMMKGGEKPFGQADSSHAGHGDGADAKKGGGMMGGKGRMMGMHKKMESRVEMLERLIEQLIEREAVLQPVDHR